jgi:membrane-associated phospholipid phosphatase
VGQVIECAIRCEEPSSEARVHNKFLATEFQMLRNLFIHNMRSAYLHLELQTASPGRIDRNLHVALASVFGLATSILVATGGYRVGFATINELSPVLSRNLLQLVTSCGDTWLAVCSLALLAKRRPRVLWMAVLAILYASILTVGLKDLFDTARPPAVFGHALNLIGPALKARSFPSGHTVTAFVTAACFSVGASSRAKCLFFALATAVGLSRVLVGVHWPVDITAGAALASLSVILAIYTLDAARWRVHWTMQPFIVVLIAICAFLELIRAQDYPLAQPLAVGIAFVSLCVLAKDYLLGPLSLRRDADPTSSSSTPLMTTTDATSSQFVMCSTPMVTPVTEGFPHF